MSKFYEEYCWIDGQPYGVRPVDSAAVAYKIISDPYRKWITVEQYCAGQFSRVIYDSRFLDFRKLHPSEQVGWERERGLETADQAVYYIRNQDDRLVYKETQFFRNDRCMECHIHSPQGSLLSIHRMSYTDQGGEFDGVVLYDAHGRLVMVKKYALDDNGQFAELIEEIRSFENRCSHKMYSLSQ